MTSQAEAQGKAQLISASFEAKAQIAQQAAMQEAQKAQQLKEYADVTSVKAQGEVSDVANIMGSPSPADVGGSNIDHSAATLDMMAEAFLKTTPPDMMDDMLQRISKKTPQLAAAVMRRQKKYADSSRGIKPLPEQKPPRGANATI
jgi:hypothetical protein